MKILITGNLGYLGPVVVKHLKKNIKGVKIVGFDTGYFAHCLSTTNRLSDTLCDEQIFGDIRSLNNDLLSKFDAFILLAAISNDPMGQKFEAVTNEVNNKASTNIIRKISKLGSKIIVFASSCSIYGEGGNSSKTETDILNPLTAYAKSKVYVENYLKHISSENLTITSLRFSTACGMSDRLRLDLVLNDFVASALLNKEIEVLSDGSPWRPLIDVKDMSRAIEWALKRKKSNGGNYLAINVGKKNWNFQVRDLALAVSDVIPGVKLKINKSALPDKRSYKVDFSLFEKLAKNFQPQNTLNMSIEQLANGIENIESIPKNFRESKFVRLKMLNKLISDGFLNENLLWKK